MKKNYPGQGRHAFWGQMEWALLLSSVSPYVCKWCRGFWKGKMGSSSFPRSHRAGRCCSLSWMSPLSASTTVGSRTALVLQEVGTYCSSPGCPIEDGSEPRPPPSFQCLKWMRFGQWPWQTPRRRAWRASTTLLTSTFRAEMFSPLVIGSFVFSKCPIARLQLLRWGPWT